MASVCPHSPIKILYSHPAIPDGPASPAAWPVQELKCPFLSSLGVTASRVTVRQQAPVALLRSHLIILWSGR